MSDYEKYKKNREILKKHNIKIKFMGCNGEDIADIQDKLEKIAKSQKEQQKLIKLGLNKAKEYSWEKCASQTSDIYKQVLNEK